MEDKLIEIGRFRRSKRLEKKVSFAYYILNCLNIKLINDGNNFCKKLYVISLCDETNTMIRLFDFSYSSYGSCINIFERNVINSLSILELVELDSKIRYLDKYKLSNFDIGLLDCSIDKFKKLSNMMKSDDITDFINSLPYFNGLVRFFFTKDIEIEKDLIIKDSIWIKENWILNQIR